MNVTLNKATAADSGVILKLMGEYYSYEGLKFKKSGARKALLNLLSNEGYGLVDMLVCDCRVVGYICITYGYSLEYGGRDCILDELYIIPEYQRKGIGSHILKLIEKQLRQNDFRAIHLEVFERNKPARDFFVKNGFTIHESNFMSKTF